MHLKQASSSVPTFLEPRVKLVYPPSSVPRRLHLSSRARPSFVSSYIEANLPSELKSAHRPSDRACAKRHHSCHRPSTPSHLHSTTPSCDQRDTDWLWRGEEHRYRGPYSHVSHSQRQRQRKRTTSRARSQSSKAAADTPPRSRQCVRPATRTAAMPLARVTSKRYLC